MCELITRECHNKYIRPWYTHIVHSYYNYAGKLPSEDTSHQGTPPIRGHLPPPIRQHLPSGNTSHQGTSPTSHQGTPPNREPPIREHLVSGEPPNRGPLIRGHLRSLETYNRCHFLMSFCRAVYVHVKWKTICLEDMCPPIRDFTLVNIDCMPSWP